LLDLRVAARAEAALESANVLLRAACALREAQLGQAALMANAPEITG
jgi:hypothetical protein